MVTGTVLAQHRRASGWIAVTAVALAATATAARAYAAAAAPAQSAAAASAAPTATPAAGNPRGFEKQVVVAAPPADVWRFWTTPEGIRAFLDAESAIDLRVGGRYEIYFDASAAAGSKGSEGCKVLSFVPERMLSFDWNAPPTFATVRGQRHWVVVTLAPEGPDRTRVTLNDLGFGDTPEWREVYAYFDRAWGVVLAALEQRVAAGPAPWAAKR
jgi:uncharacterized protein YndB with AHSA1/START domain